MHTPSTVTPAHTPNRVIKSMRNPSVSGDQSLLPLDASASPHFDGCPAGEIAGPERDRRRIEFVAAHLHFLKSKGARDLLTTSFGLLRSGIAFDARVLGALRAIGVQVPRGVPQDEVRYAAFEADLIQQVCRPLRISGAALDQLLSLNYSAIKTQEFRS